MLSITCSLVGGHSEHCQHSKINVYLGDGNGSPSPILLHSTLLTQLDATLRYVLTTFLVGPSSKSSVAASSNTGTPGTFRYMLNTHCGILARKDEICAMVASGSRIGPAAANTPNIINNKDPRIIIAVNPEPDASKNSTNVETSGSEHKVTFNTTNATANGEPPDDVIAAGKKDLHAAQISRVSAQQGFINHVRTYLQYMRAVHTAESEVTLTKSIERL